MEDSYICGLVGVVGHIDIKAEKMFKYLLQLDTVRGSDSTGIFSHSFSGHNTVIKEVGTPWDLEGYKCWDKLFSGYHKVLMGHNRAATRGKINRINAHPFEFDRIVGAHNGTLRTTYSLEDHNKYDVDSEALFNHMNKHGPDDTLAVVNGAFALSWFDKVDKTFNLARNSERPLHVASAMEGKLLVYASEKWMIQVAAGYAGIDMVGIEELPIGHILTVNMPEQLSFNMQVANKLEVSTRKVELYSPPKATGGGNFFEKKHKAASVTTTTPVCHKKPSGITSEFDVIFEVAKSGKSNTGSWYLEGDILDCACDANLLITEKVRIHPQYLSKQWNDIFYSSKFFKGKVKHFTDMEGGYYAIDLRSLREVDDETFEEDKGTSCMHCGDKIVNSIGLIKYPTGEVICGFCAEDFRKFASNQ